MSANSPPLVPPSDFPSEEQLARAMASLAAALGSPNGQSVGGSLLQNIINTTRETPRNPHAPSVGLELLRFASELTVEVRRIANHLDRSIPETVGTRYVAEKVRRSATWIARLAAAGEIPAAAVVPGSGHGRQWKFFREHIDCWIDSGC